MTNSLCAATSYIQKFVILIFFYWLVLEKMDKKGGDDHYF